MRLQCLAGDVVSLGSDDDEPMQDALTDTSMMTTFTSTPAPLVCEWAQLEQLHSPNRHFVLL